MDTNLFQELPVNKRAQMLEDNCQETDSEYVYQKDYTLEEIEVLKHEMSEDMIKQHAVNAQFTDIKKEFKEKLSPINGRISNNLMNIKHGNREVTETVYKIADFGTGMMGIYNSLGELITSRRMLPEEKQHTIGFKKAVNE